jgi:hypothetical protein
MKKWITSNNKGNLINVQLSLFLWGVFDLNERKREERNTHKPINEFRLILVQIHSLIDFHIFFPFIFPSLKSNTPLKYEMVKGVKETYRANHGVH